MTRVAIIGGGPGGLFSARCLERKFGDAYEVTLFEASGRLGGKILRGTFRSAPAEFEAGVSELYGYQRIGPDPLRDLVRDLGLKTAPMHGGTVVLEDAILRTKADIRRFGGREMVRTIDEFRRRAAAALTPEDWYEGSHTDDNRHPWAQRTFSEVLEELPDARAREYLRVAVHSDLATEPHSTNGLNGLKNVLMDVPGYIELYDVVGGIEQLADAVARELHRTEIRRGVRIARVEATSTGTFRIGFDGGGGMPDAPEEFDAVVVAMPQNLLGAIQWTGEPLRRAVAEHIAYYDRPAHYLRVSLLFERPFWRPTLRGHWFMLDAFGGCCVYDEGERREAGSFGVLSWLIAGNEAMRLANECEERVIDAALLSLPTGMAAEGRARLLEGHVHRWIAAVNAQPGGSPVRATHDAHLPAPSEHPLLLVVGDYLFDSTINGVLDSADFATDLMHQGVLRRNATAVSGLSTATVGRSTRVDRDYFDDYHDGQRYEDAYDWYFDAEYLRKQIALAWDTRPPYRLLDVGSANGQTVSDLIDEGIDAWGVENNRYIHRRTLPGFRRRNVLGDVRKLPFPDKRFDFVYDTALCYVPRRDIERAIRELHRVTKRGVVLGTVASDMNPALFAARPLLDGVRTFLSIWEWSDLFLANGFRLAVTGPQRLAKLWRLEQRYDEGDERWYPDADTLRGCFYTKVDRRAGR